MSSAVHRPATEPRRDDPGAGEGTVVRQRLVLVLLTGGFLLATVDRNVLAVVVESMKDSLGLTDTQVGVLQGFAYTLCSAVAAIPMAWAMDKWNRVKLVSALMVVFSLGTAATGAAGSFAGVVGARTVTAMSESGYSPGALSLISNVFPRSKVPRATSVYMMTPTLGNGVALIGAARCSRTSPLEAGSPCP